MTNYQPLIDKITAQSGTAFLPASAGSLRSLRKLSFPDAAVQFFAKFSPEKPILHARVRLWTVDDIIVENTQAVPGVYLQPHRYCVFASTHFGDSYCFNGNTLDADGDPEIILASHEAVCEESTSEEIRRLAKPIAPSLFSFLDQFVSGTLDIKCIY